MISPLEWRRQSLHLMYGIAMIALLYFHILTLPYLIIILVIGFILSRLSIHYRIPVVAWVLDHFERESNRKTFPGKGPIFFTLGAIVVVYLFPLKTAMAAIAILTIGDAVSHIFGKLLSKRTYKYLKSVEGTVFGIVFSFFAALLFVNVTAAFFGSMLAMLIETLPLSIDDNLLIPIIAATIISLF
ncbi:hypothetical protein HZA98_02735 [Candidatus Woesearchaeota archaeon]|nr:hypothetical protein [Candidatus Woesearchaeota archaeon]